jgi:hypothetical protein
MSDGTMPEWAPRFWAKVDKSADHQPCWVWTGRLDCGYGRLGFYSRESGKTAVRMAHRLAYELLIGPIPHGMTLDHLCRNTACVNPAHLEPVSNSENVRRRKGYHPKKTQTHCRRGHPYEGASQADPSCLSGRQNVCRVCAARRTREWSTRSRVRPPLVRSEPSH